MENVSFERLWELLDYLKMSKKDLAAKAKISLATVYRLGKPYYTTTLDVLVRICIALNCAIQDIMVVNLKKAVAKA